MWKKGKYKVWNFLKRLRFYCSKKKQLQKEQTQSYVEVNADKNFYLAIVE